MRDLHYIAGLNAAANPDSKFAKQWAKSVEKANRPRPTEAEVLEKAINREIAKREKNLDWADECRALVAAGAAPEGQLDEAERWEKHTDVQLAWITTQKMKLAKLIGEDA